MEHEDFVTFDQAQQLKQLGFDWDCDFVYYFTYHNHNKPIFQRYETTRGYEMEKYWDAPTLAQAQKWLREEKGIDVLVIKERRFDAFYKVICLTNNFETWTIKSQPSNYNMYSCDTYEEALSEGLDKALEFLK